jgi:dTDP-4-amino-4,6-dideoxygalactose transaminase
MARRSNFEYYKQKLGHISGIEFLEEMPEMYSNRWLTCILTPSVQIKEEIRLSLQEVDIESRPLWKPMHLQPVFENCDNYVDGTSEELFERGLCLPSGSNLEIGDLERVIEVIFKIMTK